MVNHEVLIKGAFFPPNSTKLLFWGRIKTILLSTTTWKTLL